MPYLPVAYQSTAIFSHKFLKKVWPHSERTDEPNRGFQRAFYKYISDCRLFQTVAYTTFDFGSELNTLSEVPHELDIIGWINNEIHIFELKHYEAQEISKDMIFSFLQKVLDFYFKNVHRLRTFRLRLFFVTRGLISDHMRQICFTWGITPIDPELYPLPIIEYYAYIMLQKALNHGIPLKEFEILAEKSRELIRDSLFSLADMFKYDTTIGQIVFIPYTDQPRVLVFRHRRIDKEFRRLKRKMGLALRRH